MKTDGTSARIDRPLRTPLEWRAAMNRKTIDILPVRRYCSGQKKGGLNFLYIGKGGKPVCIGLRRCAAITAVSFLLSLAAAAHGQDVARVKEKQPIPRGGYKSWSLFLVSRQSWLVTPNKELVADLYDRFEAFGRQIGDDHLAVWFWKDEPAPNDPRLKVADN